MFVRAYLRASTEDQDANRARDQLRAFAAERGLSIASWHIENESGAKLARPELFRLIADSQPGDVLLVEQGRPTEPSDASRLGKAQGRANSASFARGSARLAN
jgi:resolvase-like protein